MFWTLFYNASVIDEDIINNLLHKDINYEMMKRLTIDGIQKTTREINTGKAASFGGILVEILLYKDNSIAVENQHLISDIRLAAPVPQDWVDWYSF